MKANPDHRNHCSCPKLAPDLWARIATVFSRFGEAHCREILHTVTGTRDHTLFRPSPLAARRARILTKVTPPDAHGHQHWTGRWPRYGFPRAMLGGFTRDLPTWMWLWQDSLRTVSWPDNLPMRRVCGDVQCIASDHHTAPDAPPKPTELHASALYLWEREHPRPHDPRSIKWLRRDADSGFVGERCLAGHALTVYSYRPRKSYCRSCAEALRTWQRARKTEVARLDTYHGTPHRTPNEPTWATNIPYSPEGNPHLDALVQSAGPTLVEQLLAMQDESAPA